MALVINHNLMSMTATRNLGATYGMLSKSINRLSSGMRINSSADDAAGLAVREFMRSEVAVLNQGVRNANDAVSMLQTMDGAAQVIDEKLIRMKELAEQAATGTYSASQRSIMQSEFAAMRSEIERISQATDFNGIKMLNTTSGGVIQALGLDGTNATSSTGTVRAWFGSAAGILTSTLFTIEVTGKDGAKRYLEISGGAALTALDSRLESDTDIGTVTYNMASGLFTVNGASSGESQLDVKVMYGNDVVDANVRTTGVDGRVKIHFGTGNDSDEDYYYVNKQDMTATGLQINTLSINSQASAQGAIDTLNTAINTKDTARAHFGAMMNRLANTVSNLTIQAENIQAAESQISDVDVAIEMTRFVSNQIKAQAAVAMLAQANSVPQMALTLLGGR